MKNVIVNTIIFLAGGVAGYFICKKQLERTYSDLAQQEIDEMREHYAGQIISASKYGAADMGDSEPEPPKTERTAPNHLSRTSMESHAQEAAKINYNLMSRRSYSDEPVTDASGQTEEDSKGDGSPSVDKKRPYLIDGDSYANDFSHHDKLSLNYYILDHTLCDDKEEIMDDIAGTVGEECLDLLHRKKMAWVRNERIAIDYEIVPVKGSYAELVAGIIPGQDENTRALSPRERYELEKKKRREVEE